MATANARAGAGEPSFASARRQRQPPGNAGRGRATSHGSRRTAPAGRTSAGWRVSWRRIVVVAGVFGLYLLLDLDPDGRVHAAEGHIQLAAAHPFPEQFGTTDAAEPASDARRGFIPGQMSLALDLVSIAGRQAVNAERALPAATSLTVAGRSRRQGSLDLVAHGTTQAAARRASIHVAGAVMELGNCSS